MPKVALFFFFALAAAGADNEALQRASQTPSSETTNLNLVGTPGAGSTSRSGLLRGSRQADFGQLLNSDSDSALGSFDLLDPEVDFRKPSLLASAAFPQAGPGQGAAAAQPAAGGEDLNKQAVDPTASLMSFNFRDIVTTNYYGRSGSANQLQFQPAIPFVAWGKPNILRVTMPFNTGGVPGRGLGSVTVFNLTVLPVKGGRLAVGPVLNFSNNPALTTNRFQGGPAVGYVASKGNWTFGAFNQNLFSAETQVTAFQPLIAYQLGGGWALAAGDAQWSVDWDSGKFVNIPIGIQIGKIAKVGSQMVRYTFNPEYNAASVAGTPHWTLRFGLTLLVPGG